MALMTVTNNAKQTLSPLLVLMIPILALILYMNVLNNKFMEDGLELTIDNPQVTGETSYPSIWYMPLSDASGGEAAYRPVFTTLIRLEWSLWHDSSSSFRSMNIFLFIASAMIFLLLTGKCISQNGAQAVAVILFALHPMATQSVLRVGGQGNLLALCFMMLACLVMIACREGRLKFLPSCALIVLLYPLAFFSHEMGLILPLWLLAFSAMPKPTMVTIRKSRRGPDVQSKTPQTVMPEITLSNWLIYLILPLIGMLIIYCSLRYLALGSILPASQTTKAGLDGIEWPRFIAGPSVMALYLKRMLAPIQPTLIYSPIYQPGLLPHPAIGWLILLLSVLLAGLKWRSWRTLSITLMVLMIPLAGLNHWIPQTTFVSEGLMIFLLPGFCLFIGELANGFLTTSRYLRLSFSRQTTLTSLALFVALLFSIQSWHRSRQWDNPIGLWQIEKSLHPNNPLPRIRLINEFALQNKINEGLEVIREAKQLAKPADMEIIARYEASFYQSQHDLNQLRVLIEEVLGSKNQFSEGFFVYMASFAQGAGFTEMAEAALRKELEHYPNSFEAYYGLSAVSLKQKHYRQALSYGENAVQFAGHPNLSRAMENYGIILAECGHHRDAMQQLNYALQRDPGLYQANLYLARLYWGEKRYLEAEESILHGFAFTRPESFSDLAKLYVLILEDQHQELKAREWLFDVSRQYPRDISLQIFTARFLLDRKEYQNSQLIYEQVQQYSKGAQLSDIYTGMGILAWKFKNKMPVAIQYWTQALRLNPDNAEATQYMKRFAITNEDSPAMVQTLREATVESLVVKDFDTTRTRALDAASSSTEPVATD